MESKESASKRTRSSCGEQAMEPDEIASKRGRSSGGGQAMESEEVASKRARSSGGGRGGGSGGDLDRLSALPDRVLHAIMSFLKARQVVQTCVLSKRWRHLWSSVTCLDVDQDEFTAETVAPPDSHDDREWGAFQDFVDNLMLRFNIAQLDALRLHVNRARAPKFADAIASGWLRRAMKYCTPDPLCQPEGLSSGSWPMKRLYLCNVALDNLFANYLTSVFLSLEDLVLDDCTCKFRAISSHSLKSLVLKDCRWGNLPDIESPTLESLVISGGTAKSYVIRIVAPKIVHLCLDVPISTPGRIFVNQTALLPRSRRQSIHE